MRGALRLGPSAWESTSLFGVVCIAFESCVDETIAALALRGLRLRQRLHHRAAEGVSPEERGRAAVHGLQQRFFGLRHRDFDVWGDGDAAQALRESDP